MFDELPRLEPGMLVTGCSGLLERWHGAGKRRKFRLIEDWPVRITCRKNMVGRDSDVLKGLEGTIVIPKSRDLLYDGASVPLPWLVSFLSFGILRPLGILLTASIVHDYAYRTGRLRFATGGGEIEKQVRRDAADLLFREMTSTVNGLPFFASVAWSAVRLGWIWVEYGGRPRTGRPPTAHLVGFTVVAATGLCVLALFAFG